MRKIKNRLPRNVSETVKEKAKGEQRVLHSVELHNVYSSPIILCNVRILSAACPGSGYGYTKYHVLRD
jgi:hypothetical protein